MPEKHVVGNEHGHGHHAPAGELVQFFGQFAEFGHAPAAQVELLGPFHEGGRRAAGEHFHLALEEVVPDGIVFTVVGGLLRLEPVVADMLGLLQRRGKDIRRHFGKAGEILFGNCKCSHEVADTTNALAAQTGKGPL